MQLISRFLALILSLAACSTFAQRSGTESSGGGGGFVCRHQSGQISSVELLDLWESPYLHNWKIEESILPAEVQLVSAVEKLRRSLPVLGKRLGQEIKNMKLKMTPVPPGAELTPPSDTQHHFQKPGCSFVGIMFYDGDQEKLWYRQDLFTAMSETHKAAMILHEAVYFLVREKIDDQTSSKSSRKIVACLLSPDCQAKEFSLDTLTQRLKPLYSCANSAVSYTAFELPRDFASFSMPQRFVFTRLSQEELPKNSLQYVDEEVPKVAAVQYYGGTSSVFRNSFFSTLRIGDHRMLEASSPCATFTESPVEPCSPQQENPPRLKINVQNWKNISNNTPDPLKCKSL